MLNREKEIGRNSKREKIEKKRRDDDKERGKEREIKR